MRSTCICVQLCVYMVFVAAVVAADQDTSECPGPLTYYKDLMCAPIYDDENNCPKKFNCSHIKRRSREKCYINGRTYRPKQFLYDKDSNVCDTSCICRVSSVENQMNRSVTTATMEDKPVCIVNGHEYFDGEYFKVNKEPDLLCICQPGYEGKNVPPYCIKLNHSLCHPAFSHDDYFRRNCAPVFNYAGKDQCHVKMLCHVFNDIVIPRQSPFIMDDDWSNMCIFGNLLMRIGDRLEPSAINTIDCICEVPPVLTYMCLFGNLMMRVGEKLTPFFYTCLKCIDCIYAKYYPC
ncbi:hypothetical protein ALC57_15534 [Trachymyrmex cornetzi]|uniref:DUF4789 domain-containing protein n=1 Tax=Trachymyrmex cornetzi TaxID=471704 RepID=A0A151IX01_9HYME|nr:hypothetical protein ALC57_15534 [Trachymyrmex cornetzi]